MPQTNSWLCQYSISQLGRPFWLNTHGQIASEELYVSTVQLGGSYYIDYKSQLGEKVHDCSGLIIGALTCEDTNSSPVYASPITQGSTSIFNNDCSTTSDTMKDFPNLPGTLVFHTIGIQKSQVGIYIGTFIDTAGTSHSNAVMTAKSHETGVIVTTLDSLDDYGDANWDSWGQLACCAADTQIGQQFDARNVTTVVAGTPVTINTEVMTPFVATLSEQFSRKLDYDKIKEARISAMMFYGGQLFDFNHTKQAVYTNQHLPTLVQDCNDHGMPYALYVNVRARNEIEADAECRALYYMVSHYLPTLGIWLSLQLGNNVVLNDKILEIYYKYFEQWGISARCGLYVTPEQLTKVTWAAFQERFYLWEIDPMNVEEVDDELLQPELFEVPD